MTEDPGAARQLIGEKDVFRRLETRAAETHFVRRDARSESVEVGRLHLDIVRDLKRINAHLSAGTYPVLENRGELLSSRLRYDAEQ
jgi:phosphate:Na+ symporter